MKVRKVPVVVEAVHYDGSVESFKEVLKLQSDRAITENCVLNELSISTLEGEMKARKGDWIIKGVKGEVYPCKPDIFAQTYEILEENPDDIPAEK